MFLKTLGAALLFVNLLLESASATSINDLLFAGQMNQLSDNSAEWLINKNNTLSNQGDSIIGRGDRIRGIFSIETVEDLTGSGGKNILGVAGNNELTGLFDVTVVDILNEVGIGPKTILFAPTIGFAAELAGYANVPFTAAELTGMAIALFDDSTPDFTRLASGGTRASQLAAIEATAKDGLFLGGLGFKGDPDEIFFGVVSSLNIATLKNTAAGTNAGTLNFQLSFIQELLDLDFKQVNAGFPGVGGDGLIDVNGSGNFLGTRGIGTPADIFDNFDAVVRVSSVPEPETYELLGIGLLGMKLMARKKSLRS